MADPHKDKPVGYVRMSEQQQASSAASIAVKLPLTLDGVDGYTAIKSYRQLATQNLKMLVLTCPGEKMMDPMFGVGLRNFLFQMNNVTTHGDIEARINNQVGMYLPYLEILGIDFDTKENEMQENFASNYLHISIHFRIKPLDVYEVLAVSVTGN